MKKIIAHLFMVLMLSLVCTSAWAQATLTAGKVYNIVNVGNDGFSMAAISVTTNSIVATDENDYSQLWYVSGGTADGTYTFRNLSNGLYLQTSWRLSESAADLHYVTAGNYHTLSASDSSEGGDKMHYGQNEGYVVNWNASAPATQWTFNEVSLSDEDLQANWNEIANLNTLVGNKAIYQSCLDNIFSDKACTTFKSDYSYSTSETNYASLPDGLQKMVTKINSGNWTENNADADKEGWNSEYARKFRLQMYEPYSIAGDITSWLGINGHANNDNPTGIWVNGRGLVYVMVEGEIKDGASLRLIDGASNGRIGNATTGGYELTVGLNVIPCYGRGGHLYVCYNVDTYNPDGTDDATRFPHKLSEYAPLKIHIEGGAINGYYNACGDFLADKAYTGVSYNEDLWGGIDNDDDWSYMETRANLSVLPIVAHRQVLLLQLDDLGENKGLRSILPDITVPAKPYSRTETWDDYSDMGCEPSKGKLNIVMEAWDRIMYSELATMGLVSQSTMDRMNSLYPRWSADGVTGDIYTYDEPGIDGKTYMEFSGVDYSEYFNHHGVALGTEGGNPYGSWEYCGYPISSFAGEIIGNIANTASSTWVLAHEIGHQHQALLTLNGLTEVTNNLFSNIALWYKGMSTSRYNGDDGSLERVLAAFNTEGSDAYTNNIWALTHLYYRLWLYYHLAGNNTQFYPRLFELLRHNPMQKGYNVSGDVSMLHFYKLVCKAAGEDLTEFFRAHGYFSVMKDRLVGDYSNSVYNTTQAMIDEAIAEVKAMTDADGNPLKENLAIIFICDDDENATYYQHNGKDKRAIYGETSPNSDFGSVSDFINGNADVTAEYTATISASGSVAMSGGEGGVGFLVLNEKGEVVSFSNKSTFELSPEAAYLLSTGKATVMAIDSDSEQSKATVDLTAVQALLLGKLISDVEALPIEYDNSYTHIGFYSTPATETLRAALATAKETAETGVGVLAAYELLYNEYLALKNAEIESVTIPFDPSLTYILTNHAYPSRVLTLEGSTVCARENVDLTSNAARWQFKATGSDGVYNVYNNSGVYCGTISGSVALQTVESQSSAANYTVDYLGDALWTISLNPTANNTQFHAAANDSYNVVGWSSDAPATQWYITAVEANADTKTVAELQTLIEKTEELVNAVATVEYDIHEPFALQTTVPASAYYVSTNAQQATEGPIANLVNGKTDDFFHTNWSSGVQTPGSHYITVDLGSANSMDMFMFSCTARDGGDNMDIPYGISIYGSNDGSAYKLITNEVTPDFKLSKGAYWETTRPVFATAGYRYLRFNVYASRGYWAMAEFDLYDVETTVNLLDTYTEYSETLTTSLIGSAWNGVEIGSTLLNNNEATIDELKAYTTTLQEKYDALYAAYKQVIDAEKAKLQAVIDDTEELIAQVGTATVAADVEIDLHGKLYAEKPYEEGGLNHSDYSSAENGYNLLDGNVGTHYHSDYNYSTMVSPPYIRVDLGEGNVANKFEFNYTTRNVVGCAPTTLNVYGSNEENSGYTLLKSFTSADATNPLPTAKSKDWTSETIESATAYRYFKFEVEVSQGSKTENGVKKYYFAISEFGFNKIGEVSAEVYEEYKQLIDEELLIDTRSVVNVSEVMVGYANDYVVTVEQIKAQIADQQAAKDKFCTALKAKLLDLIKKTQALYDKMATEDGAVDEYYSTSELTAETLSAVLSEITDAQDAYDNASTVGDINTAFDELNEKYEVLDAVEKSDVADRDDLNALITGMQSLLEQTTVNGAQTAGSLPLQIDDNTASYYIWSNAPASDCNSYSNKVQGLIDVNSDGSANTGTFFGTNWGSRVEAYTHYIEIDLGVNNVLEDLAIDYTTRYSGAEDSRPNGLKLFGSNNGIDYEEFYSVTTGLPAGANAKWSMPAPVELAKSYRYIRIAVSSPHGSCFNMADFNLYSHCTATVKEFYSTSDIFNCLPAALREYCDAKEAVDKYLLDTDKETVKDELQAQIDALQSIIDGHTTDRTSLTSLITETNTLVEEVATVNETEATIEMQCTNKNAPYYLYCNADGTATNGDGDKAGVAALVGENATNAIHLHTTYGNQAQDDDLDHYLRLDMGENKVLAAFKFSYTGRINNVNNAPKKILVEGSNDLDNFEEIAKLEISVPASGTATYSSEVLDNGKAYRYIRFMVTATNNNAKNNGHPFFVLSQFSVTACKTIEVNEEFASPNLSVAKVAVAYNEKTDADLLVKRTTYLAQTVYDTALSELQAAKDALNVAKNLKELPVTLTTDVNNPVLYKIYINRAFNNSAVDLLAYDGESKVDVADLDFESTVQNWYFMQGTDENSYSDVLILPATADGKALATNSFSEGTGKVSAQEPATEGYSYNWEINQIADKEWYNIKMNNGSDTYYYFSNHSGSGNKMGFYNSNTSTDGGSMFRFVLADAYSVLKDCYEPLEKEPEVYAPGYFSNAELYNAAYDAASEYVNFANGTEEQYIAAYNELFAQKKALTTRTESHALEDGAVYRIMNLITKTEPGYEYHYIKNNNASITFPTTPAEDKSDLWVCKANEDGTYEFVSALGTATLGWNENIKETNAGAVKENATKFVVATGVANGAKRMAVNNNSMSLTNELWGEKGEALFNRAGNDGSTQSANWSTDWYFQKVDNADIKFKVKITKKFSSLYLPYSVVVPDGVGAFTAVDVDGTAVELVRVADKLDSSRHGTIIPARTPVVVYIEDENVVTAEYEFEYTTEDANLPDDVQSAVDNDAIIYGKILKTPVQCEGAYRYYKLGSKSSDEVAKMYWMYKEYNASGERLYPNTDNGTHISCTANKIYMKVPETLAANSFTMRFAKGEGTTDIDNVKEENGNVKTIYDLQGRKLSEIIEPGIYIVDGKKVFVK